MNNDYKANTQSPRDDYTTIDNAVQANYSTTKDSTKKRRRKVGTLGTLLAGAALLGSPGCVGHRPGFEGFFNPYAERVDWGNAGHANGYQAFMENDHPEGATGSLVQEFAPFGYVADVLKFLPLMMRKGFYGIGDHRPENPVGAFFSYIGQGLLYLGHPLVEVIELLNDTPLGRTGFRVMDHVATDDGAYAKEVNYGHRMENGQAAEPVLLDVPEEDRNKLALYDTLKVLTVTGGTTAGVIAGGSGDSGGSSGGSGGGSNPIPPVPPIQPGPGDGF